MDLHRRLEPTLLVFGPFMAGAVLQLAAIVLTTAAFYILAYHGYLAPRWPLTLCEMDTCQSATFLVRWSYLLTAVGVALTNNGFITRATEWFRAAARSNRASELGFSPKAVAAQLSIAAFASVAVQLDAPPDFTVGIGRWIGIDWIGVILWPGLWSIGIAAMGALAHAAFKAIPRHEIFED